MKVFLRGIWGLLGLFLCLNAEAATTYYFASTGGGAASCVDATTNVCTFARCVAVAAAGDTCSGAAETYDNGASGFVLNKNITVTSTTCGSTTLVSTNAVTLTLTKTDNANNQFVNCINITNASATTAINPSDADTTGTWTNHPYSKIGPNVTITQNNATPAYHILDSDRNNPTWVTGVTFAGNLGSGLYVTSGSAAEEKDKFTVLSDNTINVTGTGAGVNPGFQLTRISTGVHNLGATISGNTGTITIPSSLGTSAYAVAIDCNGCDSAQNIAGTTVAPSIYSNNLSVVATGGTGNDSRVIWARASNTGTGATTDAVNIYSNTATLNSPAGYGIGCGDQNTAHTVNSCNIYLNTVNGPFVGTGTMHGITLGRITGGRAYANFVYGFSVALISSIGTSNLLTGNVSVGASYAPFFAKGNTSATFANNTAIMDDSIYNVRQGAYGCMGAAIQVATNNSATNFYNNNCYVNNGVNWKYVVVDASQAATFANNNYYSIPTLSSPWSYQGSAQTTLAGWQGAQEASAIGVDPLFAGTNLTRVNNLRLSAGSTLRRVGKDLNIGNIQDAGNRAFSHPPSIGAWEALDFASARTTR